MAMAGAVGPFGGVSIDLSLLAQKGYQDQILVPAIGKSYPRFLAYHLAFVVPNVRANVAITSGGNQLDNFLSADVYEFTTVSAGTAVTLNSYINGKVLLLINAGANALKVFPYPTHTINALAVDAPYSLAAGTGTEFCLIGGSPWHWRTG